MLKGKKKERKWKIRITLRMEREGRGGHYYIGLSFMYEEGKEKTFTNAQSCVRGNRIKKGEKTQNIQNCINESAGGGRRKKIFFARIGQGGERNKGKS